MPVHIAYHSTQCLVPSPVHIVQFQCPFVPSAHPVSSVHPSAHPSAHSPPSVQCLSQCPPHRPVPTQWLVFIRVPSDYHSTQHVYFIFSSKTFREFEYEYEIFVFGIFYFWTIFRRFYCWTIFRGFFWTTFWMFFWTIFGRFFEYFFGQFSDDFFGRFLMFFLDDFWCFFGRFLMFFLDDFLNDFWKTISKKLLIDYFQSFFDYLHKY